MIFYRCCILPGSAEADVGSGGKLHGFQMASCVKNICVKNYENPIMLFKITIKNVGDVFY